MSHPSNLNLHLTPTIAAESPHRFGPDEVSLPDTALFNLTALTTGRQPTDAYLAGLAFSRGRRLSTLEKGIPRRPIRGASADLIGQIAT